MAATINKDFVLKLVVPATDDQPQQIRRVKVQRILDSQGRVSYDELAGLVLTFMLPSFEEDEDDGNDVASLASTSFRVTLQYQDEDEDVVTIGSTEELLDAIEQYASKKVLRITTKFSPKSVVGGSVAGSSITTSRSRSIPPPPAVASAAAAAVPKSAPPKPPAAPVAAAAPKPAPAAAKATPLTGTTGASSQTAKDIQTLMKGFVGALAGAVVTIEEGLKDLPIEKTVQEAEQAVRSVETELGKASKDIEKNIQVVEKNIQKAVDSISKEVKAPEVSAAKPEATPSTTTAPPTAPEPSTPTTAAAARPFIHGRHTCDSCLVTPIVGKRYHATNIPDYDVCAKCFDNYQGTEIQFESVEHDRDRAFQDRWHRRRERANAMQERHQNGGHGHRGHGGRRGCGPGGRGRGGRWHNHHHGPPHPFVDPHMAGHVHPHVAPHVHPHVAEPRSYDHALTEAIRRSLQDVGINDSDAPAGSPAAAANATPTATTTTTTVPSEKVDIVVEPIVQEQEIAVPPAVKPSAPSEEELAVANKAVEDENGDASRVAPIDSFLEKVSNSPPASPKAGKKAPPVPVETVVFDNIKQDEVSVESIPVVVKDILKSAAAAAPATPDSKPAAARNSSATSTPSKNTRSPSEMSFSSDAIGMGETAAAMGAALDMVAGVIDEMLNEADVHNKNDEDCSSKEKNESGALILESKNSSVVNEKSIASSSSTECNKDDEESFIVVGGGTDTDNGDEEIARAAELLGSAMFESMNGGSAADATERTSSPPANTRAAVVTEEQRQRWCVQLTQLQAMGIFDEAYAVEVLERLQAANIGSGLFDEEVSAGQVVNEYFKNK